jgi:hypothetical protein
MPEGTETGSGTVAAAEKSAAEEAGVPKRAFEARGSRGDG